MFYHILLRGASIVSLLFFIALATQLLGSPSEFLAFLQSWKVVAIMSGCALIAHVTIEVKSALEDYIPKSDIRRAAISLSICMGVLSALLICLCIGGL